MREPQEGLLEEKPGRVIRHGGFPPPSPPGVEGSASPLLFFFFFFSFFFLRSDLGHMEVNELGVELKLQLQA